MESGIWARVKTVIAAFFAGTIHPSSEERGQTRSNSPSSGKSDTLYKSVNLLTSGLLKNPVSEAGGMAGHAAWESKPNRRVRTPGTRIRRFRAAQALHRTNKRAARAAASRLRFTAVAVR